MKKCLNCGKELEPKPHYSIARRNRRKFCCYECVKPFLVGLRIKKRDWTGEKNPRWKGGIWNTNHGYILKLINPRKYKQIHRIIFEKSIGRELTSKEEVHHINGNKKDNRIENIMVLTKSEHTRLHKTKKI